MRKESCKSYRFKIVNLQESLEETNLSFETKFGHILFGNWTLNDVRLLIRPLWEPFILVADSKVRIHRMNHRSFRLEVH